MSKNALLVFSFVLTPLFMSVASGATETLVYSDKDVKQVVAKPQAPVKRTGAEEAKLAEKRKKIDERKKELNGSEWEITLQPQDKKEKQTTDTLTFQNDQVNSKNLSKRGFASTNYTISVPDGSETAVWETMKTGKDGVVFIRGQWDKKTMTGNINEQLDEGKTTKEYYFTSSARAEVPPTTAKEEVTAPTFDSTSQKAMVSKESANTTKSEPTKKKGKALISD